jgi:hypothetical protein
MARLAYVPSITAITIAATINGPMNGTKWSPKVWLARLSGLNATIAVNDDRILRTWLCEFWYSFDAHWFPIGVQLSSLLAKTISTSEGRSAPRECAEAFTLCFRNVRRQSTIQQQVHELLGRSCKLHSATSHAMESFAATIGERGVDSLLLFCT